MTVETANRLYELRKKHNLSQEELAERLGVSRQAVSKWERSEASPDTDNLIALAKIYGLSLDELIYGEQPEKAPEQPDEDEDGDDAFDLDEECEATADDNRRGTVKVSKSNNLRLWLDIPYAIICTVAYLIFGAYDVLGGWGLSWIIFVTIPIYYTLVEAIYNRRLSDFAYPVLATFIYLYLGLYHGNWHPSWIIFITIPVYYPIAEAIDRKLRQNRKS